MTFKVWITSIFFILGGGVLVLLALLTSMYFIDVKHSDPESAILWSIGGMAFVMITCVMFGYVIKEDEELKKRSRIWR